jgi:hypothetical protein
MENTAVSKALYRRFPKPGALSLGAKRSGQRKRSKGRIPKASGEWEGLSGASMGLKSGLGPAGGKGSRREIVSWPGCSGLRGPSKVGTRISSALGPKPESSWRPPPKGQLSWECRSPSDRKIVPARRGRGAVLAKQRPTKRPRARELPDFPDPPPPRRPKSPLGPSANSSNPKAKCP